MFTNPPSCLEYSYLVALYWGTHISILAATPPWGATVAWGSRWCAGKNIFIIWMINGVIGINKLKFIGKNTQKYTLSVFGILKYSTQSIFLWNTYTRTLSIFSLLNNQPARDIVTSSHEWMSKWGRKCEDLTIQFPLDLSYTHRCLCQGW